jgi:hypothetical protein
MHVPTHTTTETIRTTKKLSQKKHQVHSAGNQRRRAAVVKSHGIAISKVVYNTSGDGFFTNPQVHLSGDFSLFPQISDRLLKPSAPEHLSVKEQ